MTSHPAGETPVPAWRRLSAALFTAAGVTGLIAIDHMLQTARRGVICGVENSGLGHCWACYAALGFLGAGLLAWRWATVQASLAPRRIRASHNR